MLTNLLPDYEIVVEKDDESRGRMRVILQQAEDAFAVSGAKRFSVFCSGTVSNSIPGKTQIQNEGRYGKTGTKAVMAVTAEPATLEPSWRFLNVLNNDQGDVASPCGSYAVRFGRYASC